MLSKVLLTTGGTGGHIFPAVAVAEEIRETFPDCEIVFAGGEYGPERDIVTKAGINFKSFPARGVLGRGIRSLGSICWMGKSFIQSIIYLRSFKPEVVIGFGGYAGFMPVMAARLLKIPIAVHEQNSLPGVTNRILGKKADRIFLSFPDKNKLFNAESTVVTGNPVRKNLIEKNVKEALISSQSKRLLVVGGSQGAKAINDAILRCLKELKVLDIEIWHQTGKADFERVRQIYEKEYPDARVEAFIDDMDEAYGFASLVVCRAGATTLAELCVTGKPSILIPFPYATHNHQMTNAKYLEQLGAALVLDQSYLQEVNAARVIGDLLSMPDKLRKMSQAAIKQGRPDAAKVIVEELVKIKKTKGNA
ncbi:MAG: undecaprenyldiphospho-muramoylpentapeptide beta-N-acetylglucosaminyltransferase [Desulfonatronovibrio sp. MSAO_Bac4]|nr:MAG: undecaprenyldiphospho-muramoylpentapeptide beta-N-acetylglucosaminyltransferase [Desulfonatronovibrio sp. MSAO_Bac4]